MRYNIDRYAVCKQHCRLAERRDYMSIKQRAATIVTGDRMLFEFKDSNKEAIEEAVTNVLYPQIKKIRENKKKKKETAKK